MTFGEYLRSQRKRCNLSQRALADQVGVDFTYVSKIERGRLDPPSESTLRRIATVLDIDPHELLNRAGKLPVGPQVLLDRNPALVALLRFLSEQPLRNEVYIDLLRMAQASAVQGKENALSS